MITCSLLKVTNQTLTVTIDVQNLQLSAHLTCVYARCSRLLRRPLWEELEALSTSLLGPWGVCGDFNAITEIAERRSRGEFDVRSTREFSKVIENAGLIDAGFSGSLYSWCNNQSGSARSWARLDRVLINIPWVSNFTRFKVDHLPRVNSDHNAILLSFPPQQSSSSKPFRFQRMWTKDDSFL
ncbi:uncharacterized protein LOC131218035 [Magnolia sinica]|uniref:uncharacterized protein LOC131218035 n=1 Tax=Magnolia sinica TaxID=86752 RepID=UPI002657B821|nr:uncharacterized protein LOC131218035 [Magnolia sinica]